MLQQELPAGMQEREPDLLLNGRDCKGEKWENSKPDMNESGDGQWWNL
jgi:hypothetical protein